jgi:hypothetical protein
MEETMRVAIDLDDTITAHPGFFAWFAAALRRDGHEVVVMTIRCESGRPEAEAELRRHGVPWDQLVMLPRDFVRTGGRLWGWKGERCCDLGMDVLVDDMPEIANRVSESVLVLVPRDPSLGALTYVEEDGHGSAPRA